MTRGLGGCRVPVSVASRCVTQWSIGATTALKRDDEGSSKQALDQKVLADERAETLQVEYRQQQDQTAKLQTSMRDLETKIRQARQKRTLLLARLSRANSTRQINRVLDRAEKQSAFAQFSRLEDRVERSEAVCEAYDRLEGRDPEAEELERRFAEDDRREKVQSELEELKQRIAD